jgi:RNA polymerase sigma-70 factor (ECF subfamily)
VSAAALGGAALAALPSSRWIALLARDLLERAPREAPGRRGHALGHALDRASRRTPDRPIDEALDREAPLELEADRAARELADGRDVAAALSGDGGAFARLVERHQDAIARHLYRFTRDRAVHEELVQDVFVEAWQSLRGWRADAPLRHWLRRIATRVGYRFWTARTRRREAERPADDELLARLAAAPDDIAPREAAELAHALLAKLPPRDRLVLTLVYLDGCSVRQAAELTGWSQTMVKVQAHRARKRLAALLPGGAP